MIDLPDTTPVPPLSPVSRRAPDWWERNWPWFLPVVVLFGATCLAAFVFGILSLIKSSDAYTGALNRAKADAAVVAAIGSPIEDGFFPTGSIEIKNDTGKAALDIPIKGPKGEAAITVHARKSAGVWHYHVLIVHLPGEKSIDLSEPDK